HGDHGGGGGGRGRRRSRDLSLSLGRVLSGVGPQEAQKAQKLGFSGFCVFCAFCGQGWLEPDLGRRILTQRREGAEGRRVGEAEGRRGGSRRVTRRAEGGGTELTEAEAAEAGGDVGVPGIFLFLLYRSLSLGRVLSGVGPQEAQKAQKLGFQGSASFALFVAKVGWSRTWETNFNAKARRRTGAQRRRREGRKGRRDGSFSFLFLVLFLWIGC